MKKIRRGTIKPRPGVLAPKKDRESHTRRRLQQAFIAVAFCLLVLLLLHEPGKVATLPAEIDTNIIPRDDIRAVFSFKSVDLAATRTAQDESAARVPNYYQVDQIRVRNRLQLLEQRIQMIEAEREVVVQAVFEALQDSNSAQSKEDVVQRSLNTFVTGLKDQAIWGELMSTANLVLWLSPNLETLPIRIFEELPDGSPPDTPRKVIRLEPLTNTVITFTYGDLLRELALSSVEHTLRQGIRKETPDNPGEIIVISRITMTGEQVTSSEMSLFDVPGPQEALEQLKLYLVDLSKEAAQKTDQPTEWAKLHEAALEIIEDILVDTLRFDRVYTAGSRERAREMIEPVAREIRANMKIQAGGEPWTSQSIADLQEYYRILEGDTQPGRRIISTLLASSLLVGIILVGLYRAFRVILTDAGADLARYFNLAIILLLLILTTGWIGSYFEPSGFVIPVAAVGILFAILVNVHLAVVLSIAATVLLSAQYQFDWRLLVVGQVMSLGGVFSIFRVRLRSDMARASLTAMAVGLITMLAIVIAMDSLVSDTALRRLLLVAMNGAVCLMLVPSLLSPFERLFGITTDIQLLEYSDLNNELLNRLAIEVPGTYAHSLLLGQLAEAAADAIGANGLKARVCAYYHDIGKMRRPAYFAENQNGHNVHDALSPRLSARAIAAHVTQGAEMAREYHLPRPIIDGILEHHGTFLIGYFYQQAIEQQKHGDVQEDDFRYPGPKPQHPETAILMICDACESGIRSIKNPNEERVREFVDKIVAARINDRQFNDCNLTLRQLDIIADVVARRISINLHTRVAYPDMKSEKSLDPAITMSENGGTNGG